MRRLLIPRFVYWYQQLAGGDALALALAAAGSGSPPSIASTTWLVKHHTAKGARTTRTSVSSTISALLSAIFSPARHASSSVANPALTYASPSSPITTLGAATGAGTNVSKHFRNRARASTLKTSQKMPLPPAWLPPCEPASNRRHHLLGLAYTPLGYHLAEPFCLVIGDTSAPK